MTAVRIVVCSLLLALALPLFADPPEEKMLVFHTRAQAKVVEPSGKVSYSTQEGISKWEPSRTALIICDMWDDHWCKGAAARVAEMAGPMNKVVKAARTQGVLIIHCPSTCVDFYKDHPARKRALAAKPATPAGSLATEQRWGTAWNYPVKGREPEMPIDDSDMGCDCKEKCTIAGPWKRQIATIEIKDEDAILDNGQELFNLLNERGIDNVIMMGVHLNMCVLGRPFAIRQLIGAMGKKVVLVRDMTDTMYNSKMRPFVDHFTGTDLVVEHVEKFWCPTITSVDLVGGKPFRFKADSRPAR